MEENKKPKRAKKKVENVAVEEKEIETIIEKDDEVVEVKPEVKFEIPEVKSLSNSFAEEKDTKQEATVIREVLENDGNYKKKTIKVIRKTPDPNLGLDSEDVLNRVAAGWVNVNNVKGTKSVKKIIFSNLFTVFNILNFGIAGWLISVEAYTNLFFIVIVAFNIIIGIIQEIRAKEIIDNLSLLSAPVANVVRDGLEIEIPTNEIVLDDIIDLKIGKQICSDCKIVSGSIEVNESLLTGESDAILKKPGDVLFSGSFVVSGSCRAVVTKVGADNYIEKLANNAKHYQKPKSNLLKSLKLVIRFVGVLILILAPIYFYTAWVINSNSYVDSVVTTSGAVIGMIPSGLFLLTSIALAVGVMRLGHNKTLVQELYCIEMLARVDVLCLDKTGTITDGTMTVRSMIEYPNEIGLTTKQIISAVLNAQQDDNLTSKALEAKFGLGKKIKTNAIIPFSSSRKYSAVEFEKYGTILLGAPEFVMKEGFEEIANDVNRNAQQGYRVLLLASASESIKGNEVKGIVKPIALILIEDTIRSEAVDTIKYFKNNGVSVKVISGDNPATVSKVSERAGVENADKYISLEGLNDKDVIKAADKYTVFGRVSPHQKKLLIKTLKQSDHTVAMTGDGVNDILALKEADCSIAMASGSEAARNVSHLVLLDSNFASLPKVVNEGRRVINNIQRVASLFLTKTIFSTLLLIMVLVMGLKKYPISPIQLTMIDFLVIGIPSFILALEPNKNIIKGNFLKNVLRTSLPGALVIVASALLVFGMKKPLGLTDDAVSTTIVISTTFTCMLVLFRVCKPFNYIRGILWTLMFSAFIIMILTSYKLLELVPIQDLSVANILLLVVLMQASYPVMAILSESKGFLKAKIKNFVEWLGKIDVE